MSARHWSEETTCVGKKCLAAQVDLPQPAGPQSTTSVLRGMTISLKATLGLLVIIQNIDLMDCTAGE